LVLKTSNRPLDEWGVKVIVPEKLPLTTLNIPSDITPTWLSINLKLTESTLAEPLNMLPDASVALATGCLTVMFPD
jgi:hypothetical protein